MTTAPKSSIMQKIRLLHVCLVGLVSASASCSDPHATYQYSGAVEPRSELSMMTEITQNDLEMIRTAAIHYYQNSGHPFRAIFCEELRSGAMLIDETGSEVGNWVFQKRGTRLLLVRDPPVSSEMRYFGIILNKRNDKWTVEGDFQEIEKLQD